MKPDWTKLQAFFVAVPHQMRPYIVVNGDEPDADAGDAYFLGDHDLRGVYEVDSQLVAETLMEPRDPNRPGGQARHQAIAIACVVREELECQGVFDTAD